jgi:hypothetical protein
MSSSILAEKIYKTIEACIADIGLEKYLILICFKLSKVEAEAWPLEFISWLEVV